MEGGGGSPDRKVAEEAALTSQCWRGSERLAEPSLGSPGARERPGRAPDPCPSRIKSGPWAVDCYRDDGTTKWDSPESKLPRAKGCRRGFPRVLGRPLRCCGRPLSIPVWSYKPYQPFWLPSVAGLVCRIIPHWTAGHHFHIGLEGQRKNPSGSNFSLLWPWIDWTMKCISFRPGVEQGQGRSEARVSVAGEEQTAWLLSKCLTGTRVQRIWQEGS